MGVKKFASIVKKIHKNKISGTLTLVFPNGNRYVYIKNGEISYLKSDYPEERLGNILIKQNLINEDELKNYLKKSTEAGTVLGEYLVNEGKVEPEEITQSLKQLFQLIIEACFLEEMKDINFVEKDILINKDLFMEIKTGNLVLETFRKINHKDFETFYNENKNKKPTLNKELIFDFKNLHLNPLEGFVLSRIDGKLTLEEIKKIAFTDEITFYKTIFALDFLGLLDFGETEQGENKDKEKQTGKKEKIKNTEEKEFLNQIEELYVQLPTINYYDLLLLDYTFEEEELKKNYHKLIKKYHPDSHPELKDQHHKLHSIISQITKAYNTLKDSEKRDKYNQKMHINPFKKETPSEKEQITENIKNTNEKEELKTKIENYINAGMYYDAITLLENACKKYRDDVYFFKTLGNIYYRTPTKLKQAIHYLEKAHSMDRKDKDVLQNLAGAYRKVGFYKETYTYYRKLLALDPDNSEANKFMQEVESKNSIFDKLKNLFGKD